MSTIEELLEKEKTRKEKKKAYNEKYRNKKKDTPVPVPVPVPVPIPVPVPAPVPVPVPEPLINEIEVVNHVEKVLSESESDDEIELTMEQLEEMIDARAKIKAEELFFSSTKNNNTTNWVTSTVTKALKTTAETAVVASIPLILRLGVTYFSGSNTPLLPQQKGPLNTSQQQQSNQSNHTSIPVYM